MKLCFRLCSGRYAPSSGRGAAIYGGRWNPFGLEAIYTSESASLATLEILAHYSILPTDFRLTTIQIPPGLSVLRIKESSLPPNWISGSSMGVTQEIGESWIRENRALILNVPSSVLPLERNLILNPAHAEFSSLKFIPSVPFNFDPRLK